MYARQMGKVYTLYSMFVCGTKDGIYEQRAGRQEKAYDTADDDRQWSVIID